MERKTKIILPIVIAIILLGGILLMGEKNKKDMVLEEVIDEQNGISITVSPNNKQLGEFKISIDTHTQDISVNMEQGSELILDGVSFPMPSWQGDPLGGHHGEGTLVFDVKRSDFKKMDLIIRNVGGVERRFSWSK